MEDLTKLSLSALEDKLTIARKEVIKLRAVYDIVNKKTVAVSKDLFIDYMNNRINKCYKTVIGDYRTIYTKILSYDESSIKMLSSKEDNDSFGMCCECLVLEIEVIPCHVTCVHKTYIGYNTTRQSQNLKNEISLEEFNKVFIEETENMINS